MVDRFEPEQLITGNVRIRNTGTVPTIFAVRVTPGVSTLVGFSPEATSRTVLTPRAVGPGDIVSVPVAVRLPQRAGPKVFQVESGEASQTGVITRVIDTQIFANLVQVGMEIAMGLPGEVAPAPTLTPAQLAAQFQDGLGTPIVSVSPNEVNVGQSVRVFIQIPNSAPRAFSPELRLMVLDANNQEVSSPPDRRLSVPRAQTIVQQVDINTTGLPTGQTYGLRLSLIDPTTGTLVLDPVSLAGRFRVRAPSGPTPAVWRAGDLAISSARGPTVNPGQTVDVLLNIGNSSGKTLPATITPVLLTPGGGRGSAPTLAYVPSGNATDTATLRIGTSSAAPIGAYGLDVRIEDPAQAGLTIVSRNLSNVFSVETGAPALAPSPVPAGPQEPALVSVSGPTVTPSSVGPGDTISAEWTLRNPTSQGFRALLSLAGPGGGDGIALIFDASDTLTLRARAQVPTGQRPGTVTYNLVVRDANTRRIISGLIRVRTVTVQAPPAASPTPTPGAVGILPGQISNFATGPRGPTVDAGDNITIQFTIRNTSGIPGRLRFLIFGRDPQGNTRGSGGPISADVAALGNTDVLVTMAIPSSAITGLYGVQLNVWDPRTFVAGDPSTFLIQQFLPNVFRVT